MGNCCTRDDGYEIINTHPLPRHTFRIDEDLNDQPEHQNISVPNIHPATKHVTMHFADEVPNDDQPEYLRFSAPYVHIETTEKVIIGFIQYSQRCFKANSNPYYNIVDGIQRLIIQYTFDLNSQILSKPFLNAYQTAEDLRSIINNQKRKKDARALIIQTLTRIDNEYVMIVICDMFKVLCAV